jgi:ATP-dependent helicase/nuclease subunit A
MSMMNAFLETPLPDAAERERAATAFDRNIVVTAGAGTGKTTLLVDRMIHLLMRQPDGLALTDIVALTFTNKAANEMRVRLRERLQAYLSARLDEDCTNADLTTVQAEMRSLMARYHLSKNEIDFRAGEALRQIERSYIGTIHSFAALLLRLYPVEAAVDPQFKEDDGSNFKLYFGEQWAVWLDHELGRSGRRHQAWKQVLGKISLDVLREVAFLLCSEIIPLPRLAETFNRREVEPRLEEWLAERERCARELIERYPEDRNQIDSFARRSLEILHAALKCGEIPPGELEKEKRWFAEKSLRRAGKWSDEDYEELQRLCRLARGLLLTNQALTQSLWELLAPFVEECRTGFIKQGFISFDALLARARNLLHDNFPLREELKYLFKAILIDEFQDTDPIQYEILLYLAEKTGMSATEWRAVQLQPGKTFVVGDPKQSIYAFRRADIQGYLEVVREIILAQGGIECRLTTNFRSHSGILNVVNGVFEPLIRERRGLQPEYVSIQPPSAANDLCPVDGASFRKVTYSGIESEEELNASTARRLEAENLARWLEEELFHKARIRDYDGKWIAVRPKHVAFLFRKLTEVHLYLESLRRRGIPYVVEGEKHFYATQEIVDGVNLLRVVSNPYDETALVGLLRSPVGGLSDPEIYNLHRNHLLDYRTIRRTPPDSAMKLEPVRNLYEALCRLHGETRTLSVADAVTRIFETIPIRILAAHSFSGEQAVANIEKIRQQAAAMGRAGLATLKDVVAQLERRVLEVEEEGESALAEESVDAIKVLSIHKAKGLEFPVVVLPDASGAGNPRRFDIGVQYDWSSKLIGLRAMNHLNLAAIYLDEKKRLREEEEQKRLFYVAMTRAREHLMISSAPLKSDKGSFVAMLEQSVGKLRFVENATALTVSSGTIEFRTVKEKPKAPSRSQDITPADRSNHVDWATFARDWRARTEQYEAARQTPFFVTPTALKRSDIAVTERLQQQRSLTLEANALVIGNLAHAFLERLDFTASRRKLEEELTHYLGAQPDGVVGPDREATLKELTAIFSAFFTSRAFAELSSVSILGREVPLLMPWEEQIMEGVIDLIYERDQRLYIADYKTDLVARDDLTAVAERYRHQAEIYSAAVRRSMRREIAAFKLIFLRLGEAVEVKPGAKQVDLFAESL